MRGEARREAILEALREAEQAVSAASLAARFQVSRQIIVGDVALLRAAGAEIFATPRGYVSGHAPSGFLRQVACRHSREEMGEELRAMVDQGCTVLDTIVEHPVYGQLTGALRLSSRYDVEQFLNRCDASGAHLLADLTGGIHLHTLACPEEAAFQRVLDALRELRVLLEA